MRVICRQLLDASGNQCESSGWLIVGKSYIVLEMFFTRGELSYRIEAPGPGDYACHLARGFEVTSGFLPPAWEIRIQNSMAEFAPKEWLRDGFWEDFFNGDPIATADFERRKREIYDSEPPT